MEICLKCESSVQQDAINSHWTVHVVGNNILLASGLQVIDSNTSHKSEKWSGNFVWFGGGTVWSPGSCLIKTGAGRNQSGKNLSHLVWNELQHLSSVHLMICKKHCEIRQCLLTQPWSYGPVAIKTRCQKSLGNYQSLIHSTLKPRFHLLFWSFIFPVLNPLFVIGNQGLCQTCHEKEPIQQMFNSMGPFTVLLGCRWTFLEQKLISEVHQIYVS